MSEARYYARSASDRTDDWPLWFVADRNKGGRNCTGELIRALAPESGKCGGTLLPRDIAIEIARIANEIGVR